jgi:hypothetical protein
MGFETASPIAIRFVGRDERGVLNELAELEGRELPTTAFIVAEVDDEIVAAVTVDGSAAPLADPFRPTAPIVSFLEAWARPRRRRLRRPLAARLGLAA